ncbi:MAG: iron-containing alcohol dehydrogenase [Candidatus Sumerlaeota bacterium]|nr:iron-containing alcohol dehydrogenase [Candidatus Sumerlaeota bacterium]
MQTHLFGKTLDCACGQRHVIEPREVLFADNAVKRAPEALERIFGKRPCAMTVIMDRRTHEAVGEELCLLLAQAGWSVREIIVPDPAPGKSPVCDDETRKFIKRALGDPELILSVGSGVVCDLGKWTAFKKELPFAVFATAASMNGYASANVAPAIEGVKTLIHAKPPALIMASCDILREAPYPMTAAGLGDALAKTVSSADWRMNHLLFGDYYCAPSVELTTQIEPLYLDHPEDVAALSPKAIAALFEALLLTGVAMTMAGTSAPASGGEHMVSHALDMMSALDGAAHDLHGRQVGVGTILASELYARVLAVESPSWCEPPMEVDRPFWGVFADAVAGHYAGKIERLKAAREKLSQGGIWDKLRAQLAPMLRPAEMTRDCLKRAHAATRAEDIGCSPERLRAALLHGHEMRARFTVLDLAWMLGILPGAAGEIVM